MGPTKITSVHLKRIIPAGWPDPDSDFESKQSEIDIETADLHGGVLVKTLYLSVDPYLRGRMNGKPSYVPPFQAGDVLMGDGVVKVVRSDNKDFPVDSILQGIFYWQTYSVAPAALLKRGQASIVPTEYKLPLSAWAGPGGMPGQTAFHGFNLANPKAGETIFVSAASGAVGQIVGGLALAKGLKVIGSAGSDEKVKYLVDELGFDPASFNYKKVRARDALRKWLDSIEKDRGLDIFFDNVGGETLDDAIEVSAINGRIICCGSVSQYNIEKPEDRYRYSNLGLIVARRLRIEGFIIRDDRENRQPKFLAEVPKLLADGKLKWKEHRTNGIEKAPHAFVNMLRGNSLGKAVVVVSEDDG